MSRTLALTMTRPHEKLGIPQPLGRRLPKGLAVLNVLIATLALSLLITYIVQVNRAASRSFNLRDVEKRVENLESEVMGLEDQAAKLSSVSSLSERANQLGFVPVSRLEFVNPAGKQVASR